MAFFHFLFFPSLFLTLRSLSSKGPPAPSSVDELPSSLQPASSRQRGGTLFFSSLGSKGLDPAR